MSPPSPGGAVDATVLHGDEERLLRARQDDGVDANAVGVASRLAAERGFDAVTLVTTGTVDEEVGAVAEDAGVDVVDGDAFARMAADAGVDEASTGEPPVATVVTQLAGRWPERLREMAVELATSIDDVAEFDRELTRVSEFTDVDFLGREDGRAVVRMRFLRESLLVYVRRNDAMENVVRLTAHRESQPSVREVEADIVTALEGVLGE